MRCQRDRAVARRRARRPDPAFQRRGHVLGAGQPAGDVVAEVHDRGRPRLRREQGVERRDAVGLGRRDRQAPADVGERGLRDMADARLDGLERRQQQVALARARRARRARRGRPGRRAPLRARPPVQWPAGAPITASTAARSAGDGSGAMTCRSIAPECSPRRRSAVRHVPATGGRRRGIAGPAVSAYVCRRLTPLTEVTASIRRVWRDGRAESSVHRLARDRRRS